MARGVLLGQCGGGGGRGFLEARPGRSWPLWGPFGHLEGVRDIYLYFYYITFYRT